MSGGQTFEISDLDAPVTPVTGADLWFTPHGRLRFLNRSFIFRPLKPTIHTVENIAC